MKQAFSRNPRRKGSKILFAVKKKVRGKFDVNPKIIQLARSTPKRKQLPQQKVIARHVSALLKDHRDINRISLNTLIRIWISPKIQNDQLMKNKSIRDFVRNYPFISQVELREWIEQLSDELRRLK